MAQSGLSPPKPPPFYVHDIGLKQIKDFPWNGGKDKRQIPKAFIDIILIHWYNTDGWSHGL